MMSRFIISLLSLISSGKVGIFGLQIVSKKDWSETLVKRANLMVDVTLLKQENAELRKQIDTRDVELAVTKRKIARTLIDIFAGDPSPIDTEKRRLYVAQVAGLYKEILEPKLKHMISKTFLLIESTTNDREFDQAVKGTLYALREFLGWGETMVNEHVSNLNNPDTPQPLKDK